MGLHTTEEILGASKALVKMVLNLEKQCNKANLDPIELEQLNEVVAQARLITADLGGYDSDDDDKSFS